MQNWRKADHAYAGKRSADVRRQKILKNLVGLTALEAFRQGYRLGLWAKWKALRQKYHLVPIAAAGSR